MAEPSVFDVLKEISEDPAGLGYRNPDGSYKSTSEIVNLLLKRPQVSTDVVEVPDPPGMDEFVNVVSPTSLANIPEDALIRIRQIIEAKDIQGALLWLKIAEAKNYLTSEELDAIRNLLNRRKKIYKPVYGPSRAEQLGWGTGFNRELINQALRRPYGSW